jgi:hypothetical protein
MPNIGKRLDRLEEILGAKACTCRQVDPMAALPIVIIEDGWTPEQVEAAKAAKMLVCPIHGDRPQPVLVLRGSEVHA